jgi:hypothetical protein
VNPLEPSDYQQRAWQSARTVSLMLMVVSFLAMLGWYITHRKIFWTWQMSTAVGIACTLFTHLFAVKKVWVSSVVLILAMISVLLANTITNYMLAFTHVPFELFSGYKLVPIAVAVIAPAQVWLGYSILGVCAVTPFILFFALFTDDLRSHIAIQEPWSSLIFVIVAFFIYRHRLKAIELMQVASKLTAERKALDDLARIFLGLRDLTNTPLQSIELTAGLLSSNKLSAPQGATYLERALVRLRDLSQILSSYEQEVDWSNTTHAFDAVTLLQHKIAETKAMSLKSVESEGKIPIIKP